MTILRTIGIESPAEDVHAMRRAMSLATQCVNCKAQDVIETYTQALLQIPSAACQVCRYYANDFACLGYPVPDACSAC